MMVSTMISSGPDSFASKLSGVFQGASDTTFYVVAVYFGSVGIKNTRYAIGSMLLADLVGVCTAIALSYMFLRKVRSLVIGLLGIGVSSSLSSLRNKFFISEAICFNSQYAPRVFIQEKLQILPFAFFKDSSFHSE